MTTINPEDLDDNKDKVPGTETPKQTTSEPASGIEEGDEKKDEEDEEDDDGGERDVKPLSGKKK